MPLFPEPFFILLECLTAFITLVSPSTLATTKKEGITKALSTFVPFSYHAFWHDIIDGKNSFIQAEPASKEFVPTAISPNIHLPHPNHPEKKSFTSIPTSTCSSTSMLYIYIYLYLYLYLYPCLLYFMCISLLYIYYLTPISISISFFSLELSLIAHTLHLRNCTERIHLHKLLVKNKNEKKMRE